MSVNESMLMQILELGVTTDFELIQRALKETKNRSVDEAISWIFSKSGDNSPPAPSPAARNPQAAAPKPKPKPSEPAPPPEKSVEERKAELLKKADAKRRQEEKEKKEREIKLQKMEEDYKRYEKEKVRKVEEHKKRVAAHKKLQERKKVKDKKQATKRKMNWHKKQSGYYQEGENLLSSVLKIREKQETALDTTESALYSVISRGDLKLANSCFDLLSKILNKILKKPDNKKFRKLDRNSKKVNELIVTPLGAERCLVLLGFTRTTHELVLEGPVNKEAFETCLSQIDDLTAFMKNVQTMIKKEDFVGWHAAVFYLFNHYSENEDVPSNPLCEQMQSVIEPFLDSKEKQLLIADVLKYHENQLWMRHPYMEYFKGIRLRLVDENLMIRVLKTMAKILKKTGENLEKAGVLDCEKLGKKIPSMNHFLWQDFFVISGFTKDNENEFRVQADKEKGSLHYTYLGRMCLVKSQDLMNAK